MANVMFSLLMFVLLGPVIYTQDQRPVATQVFKFKQAWRNESHTPATRAREAPTLHSFERDAH